jgi:tripartite-type tricarboxylate transporter receptor subunit TctC
MNKWQLIVAASAGIALYPALSCGQSGRPIRLVVVAVPGGTSDFVARLIAPRLSEALRQNVIVDNKPSANGIVAAEIMAKATPDGLTLGIGNSGSHAINAALYRKLPYDPLRDFAPITQLDTVANILVVNPSMPANSLKELIALAKSKPGQLTYASPGSGSAPHIATELLKSMAGIDMVHVPYKGIPEAATDVIANRVTMLMTTTASAATFIKAGRLRALAVSSRKRVAAMPDIPTVGETLPGYVADAFRGVIAPAGVSKPVINQLAADIAAALKQPDVHDRLINDGSDPVGSTPEAFAAFLRSEMLKWGKVVKESGARPD